jgi:Fic family protein
MKKSAARAKPQATTTPSTPPRPVTLEERVEALRELIAKAAPQAIADYHERFDMSWIYHDSALEGVVYGFPELKAALENQAVSDSAQLPAHDEIRQHKAAIELVRELADKRRLPINLEVIKKLYVALAPEENEGKGPPKYRKDMPLHRLYFHEISQPDKIGYRMRQLIEWLESDETKRSTHPVRLAAKAHSKLLEIYPFPKHSGKVARLMMNVMLLRAGYPAAIIHATERQRYYEAIKNGDNAVAIIVNEALASSVDSAQRFFEEWDAEKREGRRVRSA